MAFEGLSEKLNGVFKRLRGKGRLTEADVREGMREVRLALLEADVSYKVVKDFVADVTEKCVGADVLDSLTPAQQIIKIVNQELTALMGGTNARLTTASKGPTVVMMVGLQGAGKTTNGAKLAGLMRRSFGKRPLLVACDVYRPAAINQLQVVGKQLDIPVFEMGQIDPVTIAKEAVKYAADHGHDIVFLDTAGRLHIDEALMDELKAVKAAVHPNEILLVVDAMTGQDAVNAAKAFDDALGIDGVLLTKLDGDARGGAALSVRHVTGQPIMFASNGEKLEDFDVFHPDRMASRILGMGDVLTLIEQAEQAFDADQAEQAAAKLGSGQLTLEDFLEQMQAVRKMGPLQNLIGMLPGAGQMKDQLANFDEKHLDRVQAIIRGMTPAERADPKIINASRRQRIARGSGVTVSDINDLVNRFFEARKMMQSMAGQFGGFGGGGGKKNRKGKGKGKKGKGKGPPPPKGAKGLPGGMPGLPPGMPGMGGGGTPDLSKLEGGMNDLPPGFDPSKLNFGGKKKK